MWYWAIERGYRLMMRAIAIVAPHGLGISLVDEEGEDTPLPGDPIPIMAEVLSRRMRERKAACG